MHLPSGMLHPYSYSSTLSHFLNYHQQLEDQNEPESENGSQNYCDDLTQEDDARCRSNSSAASKSFTIAAILGLNSDVKSIGSPQLDSTAVNLSVPPHGRLQLHCPPATHYPPPPSVGHGCPPARQNIANVRGALKHMSSNVLQSKKSCKSKRVRTIFTPEQLERLEAEFERQQYMVGPERLYLAHTLQLTEAQVKVWFQNRRIKWRKHHLELTHQRLAVLKQQQLLLDDTPPDPEDANTSSTDT
ncbi:unnamed protein product [Phaedon cochleariae]|uniref:Homeobox domain-containing protein n=1 Tax=Phaedon cochleariae TaxID=80249 RepID=A0A9P0DW42_PHACE|nr:unnamed protein product [Phaedon cochleariae]